MTSSQPLKPCHPLAPTAAGRTVGRQNVLHQTSAAAKTGGDRRGKWVTAGAGAACLQVPARAETRAQGFQLKEPLPAHSALLSLNLSPPVASLGGLKYAGKGSSGKAPASWPGSGKPFVWETVEVGTCPPGKPPFPLQGKQCPWLLPVQAPLRGPKGFLGEGPSNNFLELVCGKW